ncbi:MAG: hypothetical protein GY803_01795 [Chloroflexi bacterium]|nr:hypothetical protein [Chloroflexota bacterium]
MMRFLVDEDFDNRIVRGLIRRLPTLDLVRVQDTEVAQADDTAVLEWAAQENRIILTHDVSTMTFEVARRVQNGLPMPGAFFVNQSLPIGIAIEELLLVARYSFVGEYQNQIRFIPLE